MSSYFTIQSFVGEATSFASDPVRDAVKSATKQAENYLDDLDSDGDTTSKVISTTTHIIEHGDYFSYIITMTLEVRLPEEDES